MSRPTTSDATESRESAEESGRMELSENIKRLRFMQAKKSTAGRSQQPVKQNPQKFFYQQQLQMLRQQQKHHQELRLSNKGKTNERSPSLPQQSEALQLRQLHELRRHWCAPGWECAEAMYAMQEEEDTKTQRRFAVHQSAGSKNKQAGHICRRAYGGMNAFVENNMRKIEKKVLQLERRAKEEREARRWQDVHSGRQGLSAL